MKTPLANMSSISFEGSFGAKRKYDTHTGVDLYCNPGDDIFAIEAGVVVGVFQFTGVECDSPWWNDTYCVLIEGNSGVILYGEIKPDIYVGALVKEAERIGSAMQVLKEDKGKPTTMLHLELYKKGYCDNGVVWKLEEPQPEELLDPMPLLENIK